MKPCPLALLLVLIPTPGLAQDPEARMDTFALFTGCSEIRLVVEQLPEDARDLGLTRETLERAARSRLRSARIYHDGPASVSYPYLYINVNVVSPAHNVLVEFEKRLVDPTSGHFGFATTWDRGLTGTHGRGGDVGASFVIQGLSRIMDEFIDEYMRVNGDACTS